MKWEYLPIQNGLGLERWRKGKWRIALHKSATYADFPYSLYDTEREVYVHCYKTLTKAKKGAHQYGRKKCTRSLSPSTTQG